MALEMRAECERCRQTLGHEDAAFVCSFECTYCADCAEVLGGACEACAGELVRRPRRRLARGLAPSTESLERMVALAPPPVEGARLTDG